MQNCILHYQFTFCRTSDDLDIDIPYSRTGSHILISRSYTRNDDVNKLNVYIKYVYKNRAINSR